MELAEEFQRQAEELKVTTRQPPACAWADAFARLAKTETDQAASLDDARLIGVFEHFYDNNRSGNGGYGTHYVVLGYELRWPGTAEPRPDDQHSELRWWPVPDLLASDHVHENAKAYFRSRARRSGRQ